MKNLFTLRHGDSIPGSHGNDKERPLSKEGQKELKQFKKQQLDLLKSIDLVLCSSSMRTRETLDCLIDELRDRITVCYIDALYHANPEIIFEELGLVDDKFNTVLVIAHNPGVTMILTDICEKQGVVINKAMRTGEMAEFVVQKETWQGVQLHDLKFIRQLSAKK